VNQNSAQVFIQLRDQYDAIVNELADDLQRVLRLNEETYHQRSKEIMRRSELEFRRIVNAGYPEQEMIELIKRNTDEMLAAYKENDREREEFRSFQTARYELFRDEEAGPVMARLRAMLAGMNTCNADRSQRQCQ